eukprot:7530248-Alexandrium_andersonii.AAC.1
MSAAHLCGGALLWELCGRPFCERLKIDVGTAHLRAFVGEDVHVALPPEVAEPGTCVKPARGLHGARAARA